MAPCWRTPARSVTALVRYRLVDYSAPAVHAHKKVTIKGYVDRVEIALGAGIVARHRRSYVRGDVVYDPLHYLSLLEKKPGALDQAAPLRGWNLDPAFDTLRRLLESRFGPRGKRDYIRTLRLLEDFPERQVTRVSSTGAAGGKRGTTRGGGGRIGPAGRNRRGKGSTVPLPVEPVGAAFRGVVAPASSKRVPAVLYEIGRSVDHVAEIELPGPGQRFLVAFADRPEQRYLRLSPPRSPSLRRGGCS